MAHDNQSDIVPPSAKRSKSPDGRTAAAGNRNESEVKGAAEAASSTASEAASTDAAAASDQGVMQKIMALMKDKDVKVVQKAATAAGHICAGHAVRANLDPALEGLFALGFNKNEDVLFTVGEALCFAFGGESAICINSQNTTLLLSSNWYCSVELSANQNGRDESPEST